MQTHAATTDATPTPTWPTMPEGSGQDSCPGADGSRRPVPIAGLAANPTAPPSRPPGDGRPEWLVEVEGIAVAPNDVPTLPAF